MSNADPPDSKSAFHERRSSVRIPVEMWVEESTERELYFQRGANISEGGIFLERTIPHPRGTVVTLQFTLPNDTSPVKVRGEIVNVGEASNELGMGVKFLDLAEGDRQRIQSFIERAAKTRRRAGPTGASSPNQPR
jgi:uncharacterized protein (TIGR02266 family)